MTVAVNLDPDLACIDCDKTIRIGDLYVERIAGAVNAQPIYELVCVPCGSDQ